VNVSIPLAASLSIREAGLDEYWLQKQIYENPACLGLGELDALDKERRQGSGGRLDILLKDPEDDAMYEVEVMLGETDETHIIRTIEYWDNEKRRWPQRKHFAVLVAEHINRRFFNVIHLLSHSIPIIAIQASLLQVSGQRFLSFTKVLDTYEEVDDGTSIETQTYNREAWNKKASWTLETADALFEIAKEVIPDVALSYVKHYVAIVGKKNYVWLHKRSSGKSLVGFRISDIHWEKVAGLLDGANIVPNRRKSSFLIVLDQQLIKTHRDVLRQILELSKEA
jgi:hypothetical protein